jgi:hypothetical protein
VNVISHPGAALTRGISIGSAAIITTQIASRRRFFECRFSNLDMAIPFKSEIWSSERPAKVTSGVFATGHCKAANVQAANLNQND